MATATSADQRNTDEFGIERVREDEPGVIDRYRDKWEWFDHVMRMQERYSSKGGNQFSAGITYFSVLAVFPILMLVFAVLGFVLAANPSYMQAIQDAITESVEGGVGDAVNDILETAIEQRGAVAGIGAITALWSGLGWMANLRYGVSKMWNVDPTKVNFVKMKLKDLVGLLGLLLAFAVAFGVTAVGSSGLTMRLLEKIHLDGIPGITIMVGLVAIAVGILANFLVMSWMIIYLPRTHVPRRSGFQGALIGALAFEVIKQLGSLFASNALSNPAGATFGPIIGLMVLLYLVWRILLYVSAWAATTKESLAETPVAVPTPAVIRVRNQVQESSVSGGTAFGLGAAVGAVGAGLLTLLRRR